MTVKVYLEPTGLYSRAMVRIARALEKYAPSQVDIIRDQSQADLTVLYLIDHIPIPPYPYAIVQCCLHPTGDWSLLWDHENCQVVWSYYDLSNRLTPKSIDKFYHAPLGIDQTFVDYSHLVDNVERNLVITSGYVSGPGSEPIEESWTAINKAGLKGIHVGPSQIKGMVKYPFNWNSREGISDSELANLYRQARYVIALRYVEGFELMAAEGLACGAKPIMFAQTDLVNWYGSLPFYIPECEGETLSDLLTSVMLSGFGNPMMEVSQSQRRAACTRFDWKIICKGFWDRVLR